MSEQTRDTAETIEILERKVGILKREYDQYFLGTRPRAPILARGEVHKLVAFLSNTAIQNTALRFKFSSICSRFQAYKRQWIETLRRIDDGTYSRHRFKANLHEREQITIDSSANESTGGGSPVGRELFSEYVEARRSCGQNVDRLTPEKLEGVIRRQREQLRELYADSEFRFRVVVEDGKAKLKARRLRGGD